jgi:hypothetical protein
MPFGWDEVSRDTEEYRTCRTAVTVAFAVVGGATAAVSTAGVGTPAGYLGGAAWGLATAYLACPYLVPAVKKKLELGASLTDSEVSLAVEAMAKHSGIHSAKDGVRLLSQVRPYLVRRGKAPAGHPSYLNASMMVNSYQNLA